MSKRSRDGLCITGGIYPGGILEVCKTQKQIWEIHLFSGDFVQNRSFSSFGFEQSRDRGSLAATERWRRRRPGGWRARVRRGKRRGAEGDLDGGLTGGRGVEGQPEYEEGRSLGGRRLGLQARAALRRPAGDGDWCRRCGSASRCSWHPWLVPASIRGGGPRWRRAR
jgi:hypothetical protein